MKWFEDLELVAGVVLFAVITFLVFIAALMRQFDHPLIWSVDAAQLLFIWLCFIGAARAMRQRMHLGVDFVARMLPRRARFALEAALMILFTAFLLILVYQGYKLTQTNPDRLYGDSGIPYFWVTISVPVGSLLLIVAMVQNLVEARRRIADEDAALIFTPAKSKEEA